jgi:hypothetical protein
LRPVAGTLEDSHALLAIADVASPHERCLSRRSGPSSSATAHVFFGRALLALYDALGRILIAPAEASAGAMLALIGGPYLVRVIRQRKPFEEA